MGTLWHCCPGLVLPHLPSFQPLRAVRPCLHRIRTGRVLKRIVASATDAGTVATVPWRDNGAHREHSLLPCAELSQSLRQVVLDLATAVKELVENAIDAGATKVR